MWALHARLPLLEATQPDGLPPVARQRLQFFSAFERATPDRMKDDLWQMNHVRRWLANAHTSGARPLSRYVTVCNGM